MSNPFKQDNGWLITSWVLGGPQIDAIPDNAFQLQAPLTIQIVPDDSGLYAVTWLNQDNDWCSASGLKFDANTLTLNGRTLVNFGGQSPPLFCFLTLTMTVSGFISVDDQSGSPEVGSGTFTATANPTPPPSPPPMSDKSEARKKSSAKRKR